MVSLVFEGAKSAGKSNAEDDQTSTRVKRGTRKKRTSQKRGKRKKTKKPKRKKQGRIHGNPVADGWEGAVMRKPAGIQKCDGRTDIPTDRHGKV